MAYAQAWLSQACCKIAQHIEDRSGGNLKLSQKARYLLAPALYVLCASRQLASTFPVCILKLPHDVSLAILILFLSLQIF